MNAQDLSDLLPPVPPGWELLQEDKVYTPESLYDYIDGGAELYLSYGMNEVISRIVTQGNNEIRIEIFDMMEARNAFGVFTNTRTKDEKQYGQGSQYFTGTQIFWKDKYYIAITANDENAAIVSAIKELAASIDSRIKTTGQLPEIVQYLPREGLQPDGYLYFHHYIWLNALYYIADDNFLNIESDTPAVLAKYNGKEDRIYLLLIQYSDQEKAEVNLLGFRERFLNETHESYQQVEDKTWLGAAVKGSLLICIFNAKTLEEAQELVKKVSYNP
jgi:hypothetical protein